MALLLQLIFAGGILQKDDLSIFTPHIHHVQKAWLIGESAQRYACFLKDHHIPFECSHVLDNAVQSATQHALSIGKGTILFSPGCASFDQFHDYTHRGQVFKSLVQKIKQGQKE